MSRHRSRPLTDSLLFCILGICIGLLLSGRACNKDKFSPQDTIYVKGTPDTIIVVDTITKSIYKPIPYEVHSSNPSEPISNDDLDSIRVYVNTIGDSTGGCTVLDSVRGFLLSQNISLQSKKTFINRVDTLKILIPTKDRFRLGVGASINDSLQPSGYIVAVKGRNNYLGSYNVIRKQITIGVGINLIK